MNFAVVGVVLQLMLICSRCSADQPQDEGGESAAEAQDTVPCQNFEVLMVHNSSRGMKIRLTSTLSNTTLRERNADLLHLPDRYLPPECGANNYRCSILHIERSKTSYYIVPSIGGLIILSRSGNYTGQEFEELRASFITIEQKCNPIKAFYTGNYVVVACMDLPTGSRGELFYLRYDFTAPSGDTVRDTILTNTRVQSDPIYNTSTVSEVILITGQKRCPSTSNLYVIDDAYVVHSPTKLFTDEFTQSTEGLQDCVGYLENFGDDIIVIRCTNNKTVLYDTCNDGRFNYQPLDHIAYPCSSWNIIAYLNGSQLVLDRGGEVHTTQKLPFDDISFGRCVQDQGADKSIFIASSADGSLFITRFDGNNVTKITSSNCSNNDDMSCPRPAFSENEHVFGTFDSETNSFVIINVTEGCTGSPVIAQIPIPSIPDLMSISLGRGTYSCSCSTVQNTETSGTTQALDIIQTEPATIRTDDARQMKATVVSNPSESTFSLTNSAPQPRSNASSTHTDSLLASVITGAAALILTVVIMIIVYKCCHRKGRKEDFHLSTQSQQESNRAIECQELNTDHGNNTLDQSDGGSQSSENTTSTSISGSVGSTVANDELVTVHTESGPPGGETHVPSKGALPLSFGQLSNDLVYGQYQSRISDNKHKEDMEDKVDFFYNRRQ